MIASRRPRGRKCSAARRTACSKSGCSKSLMGLALLRLPSPRVSQRGENPEIIPGEGIQTLPQVGAEGFGLAYLLADGDQQGPDTRRFGRGGLQQALEAPGFAEVPEQFLNRLLGRQFAGRPPVA